MMFLSICSWFANTIPKRAWPKKVRNNLFFCCFCYWHGPTWHARGANVSHLAMSYHYLCFLLSDESAPASCWGAGLYLMVSFSRGLLGGSLLQTHLKKGLWISWLPGHSPSFNKVKSKALSIRQWARGTVDAAVFNPRDATVHCMLGCSLIWGPLCTALTWGLFSSCGRADLLLDGDKDWAPRTPPADRNIDKRMERETGESDGSEKTMRYKFKYINLACITSFFIRCSSKCFM